MVWVVWAVWEEDHSNMTEFNHSILNKIENALRQKEKELKETGSGNWGNPIGGDVFTKDDPQDEDVPNLHDTRPYKTHVNFPSENDELREADEEIKKVEKTEKDIKLPEPDPANNMPDAGQPSGDMSGIPGGEMGADGMPGMGMPGEEEPKDPQELGRVYEMKKIYARLISIESYLSTSSDVEILTLRKYVSQSIEMFKVLTANIDSYKENIDEIIVIFYKFLKVIYKLLDKYYKEKEAEDKKYNKNPN